MLVPKSIWIHAFCFSTSLTSLLETTLGFSFWRLTPTLLSVCMFGHQINAIPRLSGRSRDLGQAEHSVAFSWPEVILERFHPSQPASLRAIPQLLFQWLTRQIFFSAWLEFDSESSLLSEQPWTQHNVAKVGAERWCQIHGNFKPVNQGMPKSALILYFLITSANKLPFFHSKLWSWYLIICNIKI